MKLQNSTTKLFLFSIISTYFNIVSLFEQRLKFYFLKRLIKLYIFMTIYTKTDFSPFQRQQPNLAYINVLHTSVEMGFGKL